MATWLSVALAAMLCGFPEAAAVLESTPLLTPLSAAAAGVQASTASSYLVALRLLLLCVTVSHGEDPVLSARLQRMRRPVAVRKELPTTYRKQLVPAAAIRRWLPLSRRLIVSSSRQLRRVGVSHKTDCASFRLRLLSSTFKR